MAKDDKKNQTNEVKEEEKKAESTSAKATVDKKEAEEASEAKSPEAEGEGGKTPAEVEAINTDNATAQEATSASAKEPKGATATADKEAKNQLAPRSSKSEGGEPTGKFKDLIKDIESLTTLELADLVKELEERFGVSSAAPMMAAGVPATGGTAPEEEEKASYTVVLADSGAQKIAVIKALREINQELGLKEAKDLADGAPKEIKKDMPKAEAEEAKKKLEAAGAKVELK